MSKFVADHLTNGLVSRLSIDRAIEYADRAIVICTVDEHGWPHPAMLSSLELVARDARNIRLSPHVASRTARNLKANGRLTLILANATGVHYIKGDVLLLAPSMTAAPELAKFNMRVDSVLEDNPADFEDARIISGIAVTRAGIDVGRARSILTELLADRSH